MSLSKNVTLLLAVPAAVVALATAVQIREQASAQRTAQHMDRLVHNFKALSAVQVQAGRFKIPFSLDELTGSFDLDFARIE